MRVDDRFPLVVCLQIAMQHAMFYTWRQQSTLEDLQLLLKSRQLLVSEGDVPFIGFSVMHFASRALFSSSNLTAALPTRNADLEFVRTTRAPDMTLYLEAHLCYMSELAGCVNHALMCPHLLYLSVCASQIGPATILDVRHLGGLYRSKMVPNRGIS